MDEKLFAVLVAEGIRRIPARFRRHLDDIAVVIEDAPSRGQAREMRLPRHADLFGLYEGTPRTERQYLPFRYPEKITIFRRAFERHCGSDEDCIREEVAHTVWHELGHALGMSERQIRAAERRRRRPQT
jgi:predicted Zn-dependent protease with MMP-like domain